MPAPKTSARKTARTTQPQFLGTSHVRHTGSIIMTLAVELPSSSGTSYVHTLRSWSRVGQPRCGRGRMRAAAALDVLLKAEPEWREGALRRAARPLHSASVPRRGSSKKSYLTGANASSLKR